MNGKQRRYDGIEWDQLYKRLRIKAECLTRTVPDVFDLGVSAEDLVSETLLAFLNSPDGLGWKAAKGTVVTFLLTVLKNHFFDHVRHMKKQTGSLDDPDGPVLDTAALGTMVADLEYQEWVEQLRRKIGEQQDLQDLITAVELTDGSHNINQQLAEVMGKTESQIINLRRQLVNVTGVRKLYEQRRRT